MLNKFYLDITLVEVAYWWMRKKRIEPTTGNLFWIMEKILKKIEMKNKNTKQAKIKFRDNHCEIDEIS